MRKLNTQPIKDFIVKEGIKRFPEESCGVIAKVGRKSVPFVCRNVSAYPEENFLIDPKDYADVSEKHEIIGIWHTHTNKTNQASQADRVGCENTELPWLILNINRNGRKYQFSEVNVITPSGFMLPYLGRPYVFGVLDCFTLMRDYYRREFGIILPDTFRTEEWWKKGLDTMDDYWKDHDFVDVTGDDPKRGDCFLMQMEADVPNHVGIYIGDEMMLHHLYGRLSTRDIYGGYYYKHTRRMIRHRENL